MADNVQQKASAILGWRRYISRTESYVHNDMEVLKEEIHRDHPF